MFVNMSQENHQKLALIKKKQQVWTYFLVLFLFLRNRQVSQFFSVWLCNYCFPLLLPSHATQIRTWQLKSESGWWYATVMLFFHWHDIVRFGCSSASICTPSQAQAVTHNTALGSRAKPWCVPCHQTNSVNVVDNFEQCIDNMCGGRTHLFSRFVWFCFVFLQRNVGVKLCFLLLHFHFLLL